VFLYAGRIEEEGPPDRIFSDPHSDRTRTFLRSIIEAKRM
jgi:polar amino acid transport system ATP-binding protein